MTLSKLKTMSLEKIIANMPYSIVHEGNEIYLQFGKMKDDNYFARYFDPHDRGHKVENESLKEALLELAKILKKDIFK